LLLRQINRLQRRQPTATNATGSQLSSRKAILRGATWNKNFTTFCTPVSTGEKQTCLIQNQVRLQLKNPLKGKWQYLSSTTGCKRVAVRSPGRQAHRDQDPGHSGRGTRSGSELCPQSPRHNLHRGPTRQHRICGRITVVAVGNGFLNQVASVFPPFY